MGEVSVREISQMLNRQAESLCRLLLPNGKKLAGYWSVGSVEGEPGQSLKVRLTGHRAGSWADYSRDRSERAGTGDMLKLIELTIANNDIGAAVTWAKGFLGLEHLDDGALQKRREQAERQARRAAKKEADETERKRRNAHGLWLNAAPMKGTPAQRYLEGRGIDFAVLGGFPGAIRYHREVWNAELGRKIPAMVTGYWGLDGQFKAVHVTYLEHGGRSGWIKARVEEPKKTWSPAYWGAFMPLWKGVDRSPLPRVTEGAKLHVSEGIENGLSVAVRDPSLRIVAAGTLGNIGALELPPQLGDLVIIRDNDKPGSAAEESFVNQAKAQQRRAHEDNSGRLIKAIWPQPEYKDFNDDLRGIRMESAA